MHWVALWVWVLCLFAGGLGWMVVATVGVLVLVALHVLLAAGAALVPRSRPAAGVAGALALAVAAYVVTAFVALELWASLNPGATLH